MTLLYEKVVIDTNGKSIEFPEFSRIVGRKEAESLSAPYLDYYLRKPMDEKLGEKTVLEYARGKSGGCARLIEFEKESYMVCPLKDWVSSVGQIKYAADIQAGMTTEGQEIRDSMYPWSMISLGEGMEETSHWLYDGKDYEMILGNIDDANIKSDERKEIIKRVIEESNIVNRYINANEKSYMIMNFYLIPLKEQWKIREAGFPEQEASVAFTEKTGGLEIIPGILKMVSDYGIAEETGSKNSIYSVDTEKGKEWLNRITVHMNVKDGHIIAHKANPKTKEVEVVYNGDLEKALAGELWDSPEKRKVPPAREKLVKVIEEFPESLGTCEGLYPFILY
jgi:hypothetical protein